LETEDMIHANLVAQCKANNRRAQLTLYRQYCDGMYCVAMRFLQNPDDAEDVLQEAFIRAFQKIDHFSGEVSFGAWLKRIVINKCLDFLKSRKPEHVPLREDTIRIADDEDWTVEEGIGMEEVKDTMARLPEKYRYVVQMYLVEGLDHEEISQVLGLTATNCRTRLLRGRVMLKEQLKQRRYGTGS
jgi:RNA polymerase sigma factor (sigma-70 family)